MSETRAFERPRWMRDLRRFLPLKPQFVLSGNVRDLQFAEVGADTVAAVPLTSALASELRAAGFAQILAYDPVTGFRVLARPGDSPSAGAGLLAQFGLTAGSDGAAAAGLDLFSETLQRVVGGTAISDGPVAVIADFASRLIVRNDVLTNPEHQAFTRALVLSHQVRPRPHGTPPRPFFNTVVWIVDKEGDLPDWLVVDNPRIRHIPVARPDHRIRRQLASTLLRGLDGAREASPAEFGEALSALVEQTEAEAAKWLLNLRNAWASGQLALSPAAARDLLWLTGTEVQGDPLPSESFRLQLPPSAFFVQQLIYEFHFLFQVIDPLILFTDYKVQRVHSPLQFIDSAHKGRRATFRFLA
ncbi:MAG: hypothetical protein HC900_12500 [Methylacidiphilales bacterium]|nr:hypothetical protein [Candidatus Methylacidiphilales bacterium]